MDWLGNDMKLSYIMTDITNIFPLLLSMNRPDRLLLPPININKGSKGSVQKKKEKKMWNFPHLGILPPPPSKCGNLFFFFNHFSRRFRTF